MHTHFNFQIAINTPVNSLSSISAIHMQDKFAKISQLLHGKIPFPNSNVDHKAKESCISFIIDFLSKRFIVSNVTLLRWSTWDTHHSLTKF